MSAFSKISLGRNSKKYSHNMSFDNNTSFPFGVVQPLMCQPMLPDSSISVSYRQLMRLAPMPVPTFGRISLRSEAFFVPITDVCPYFEAMLGEYSYPSSKGSLYYPTQVPYTSNAMLVSWLLFNGAYFSAYYYDTVNNVWVGAHDPDDHDLRPLDVADYLNFTKAYLKGIGVTDQSTTYPMGRLKVENDLYNEITPDGADFVVECNYQTGLLLCFRLSNFGKRLRSNLIGCGYSLNIRDKSEVSILPLLAYYKAWFDNYEVKRSKQWLDTSAYRLITKVTDDYSVKWTETALYPLGMAPSSQAYMFDKFMKDLGNTWYVEDVNYISAHRTGVVKKMSGVDLVSNTDNLDRLVNDASMSPSLDNFSPGNPLTLVSLQALSRLTRFINKDSVIGGKLNDWLRNHYGADISNSLYRNANHIGSFRLDTDISEVISTSDTANTVNGTGEYLGSYAGKGIGFDKNGFHFKTDIFGFVFFVSSVVPQSRFFQGNDPTLYAIDKDGIPIPDYDALGFELTPEMSVFSDNGYSNMKGSVPSSTGSFGYIPRYSGWKCRKDVINGDMSRKGVINSTSAYYLNRFIVQNHLDYESTRSEGIKGEFKLSVTHIAPPTASEEWRYPTRYPWLGNFNRIFYNSGSLKNDFTLKYGDSEPIDDNFYCQTVFDVKITNFLKPVSLSYDTFCEEIDSSSHDTKQD